MTAQHDLALLRRFEPIIRYTRGEQFFPMDVDLYVRASSLWVRRADGDRVCLVPEGSLTLEALAAPRSEGFGSILYLRFIEPLNIARLAAYSLENTRKRKDALDVFRAGRGRLARVGYVSRLVDALFTLTLLARGRVPGATAAAASLAYKRLLGDSQQDRYCYYARVERRSGWVVLQYWYFYPFNNWRSGFFGVNDHEGDWEMACVYLSEARGGDVTPEWVAYASHDFQGDDLRRRWDDPELERVGEHPVIYAGAGSHASYFSKGEYLTEVEIAFLAPVGRVVRALQDLWCRLIQQASDQEDLPRSSSFNIFRVPFVDYARGDGLSLGAGQRAEWGEPRLLQPVPVWVSNYRGLWGLYARDPIAGEDAPAGPMYNRDASVRRSWYDPLGWGGLDKVPPSDEALSVVLRERGDLQAQARKTEERIEQKSHELMGLGVQLAAMAGQAHLKKAHDSHQQRMAAVSAELDQLQVEQSMHQSLLDALETYEHEVRSGQKAPARAHIRRAFHPASDAELRLGRVAETWAAISVGLMIISFVALVLFASEYLIFGLVGILSLLIFVEAGFRGRLTTLVNSITVGLAMVCSLIILFEFFWPIVVLAVLAAALYMMWDNLRELWT